MVRRKLGRGLGALLSRQAAPATPSESVLSVAVADVRPNPWQPRSEGSDEGLKALADSIKTTGILQPVVLRRLDDGGYELVAGQRRWRAAGLAGLAEIPAVIREVPDDQMLLLALLENLLREDLNPIDRAQGYARLMKEQDLTQEELARQLGEARATVANMVRLLDLPEEIQDLVSRGTLSAGHGRALLPLRDAQAQRRLCARIIREGLSVRQVEQVVSGTGTPSRAASPRTLSPHIRELQERIQRAVGGKVSIRERKKGGKITIDLRTHDDFDRFLSLIEHPAGGQTETDSFHV